MPTSETPPRAIEHRGLVDAGGTAQEGGLCGGHAALVVIMAPLTSLCTGGSRRQSTRISRQGDIVKQWTWPRWELLQVSFNVRVCTRQLVGAWLET